jgi:predicted RND superfamily exporter protein
LRTFGFVCATTLLASLLADLVFLPGLIMLVRTIWPSGRLQQSAN